MLPMLIGIETFLLAVLGLLVLGLLRSHAEILRWQTEFDERRGSPAEKEDPRRRAEAFPTRAPVIWGLDIATLEPVEVDPGRSSSNTLLAFLTSGCIQCEDFWRRLRENQGRLPLPGGGDVVVIGKDRTDDSLSRLRKLAASDVPVVLSSQAWHEYAASGSPFFVHVQAGGTVLGAGVSRTWDQLNATLENALEDIRIEVDLRAGGHSSGRLRIESPNGSKTIGASEIAPR